MATEYEAYRSDDDEAYTEDMEAKLRKRALDLLEKLERAYAASDLFDVEALAVMCDLRRDQIENYLHFPRTLLII
jgi:hypothetical protein